MIYGSVCSGIEAATMAWHPLGWRPSFLSEIDPFARTVLRHHYPDVPLHGDFTTIEAERYDPIDLLVGGTPCQTFSIAGLRRGLGDDRGNLALEFLRLAGRLRPRWLVWENVPGVLSSLSHDAPDPCPPDIDLDGDDGPEDGTEIVVSDEYEADESHALLCFLAGASELGYGGGFRIIDTQFTRTCDFPRAIPQRRRRVLFVGYRGDWRRAGAVLFDGQSLSGNPPPRRSSPEEFAGAPGRDLTGERGVVDVVANSGPKSFAINANFQGSLDAEMETLIAFNSREDPEVTGGRFGPLGASTPQAQAVAFDVRGREGGAMPEGPHETASIRSPSGGSSRSYVAESARARRLMPVECERLQGFPDGFTDVPWRGKSFAPDTQRYKVLGNSMSVNVMRWIGDRIEMVERAVGENAAKR